MIDSVSIVPGGCDNQTDIRRDWRSGAACRAPEMTALMFDAALVAEAKAVCAGCSVLEVCLWDAMAEEGAASYRYGVRGGLSRSQRRQLATSLAAADELPGSVIAKRLADELANRREPPAPGNDKIRTICCGWCGAVFSTRYRQQRFCRMSCSEASRRPSRERCA